MRTRLKVCCIASIDEAQTAIRAGADALGLVSSMPSGPGPIPDERIREIADRIPPPIASVLLTSRVEPEEVVAHVRSTGVNTVQLVDDTVGVDVWRALKRELPGIRILQVIHVIDEASIATALSAAAHADALLLDSGRPSARELGGTGRVHDWSISAQITRRSRVPVFLAGGLNPMNVGEAIAAVRPFGVDLCSGVRTDGALDPTKLEQFVRALRLGGVDCR